MPTPSDQAQVVVWGGGTGGVAAALQAARSGADTLLLTPGPWLGGMVSAAGVCAPDGNELTPWQTGLWGAFLRALQRREPDGLDHNWVSCFGYRPATAEAILREWVAAAPRLRWWPEVELQGVCRRGNRLTGVELLHEGERVQVALQILIDGSDRGDCFPLAGAPYRLGWEAREQWGEPSAPSAEALRNDPFFERQPVQSPTWVVMGQLTADRPSRPLPAPAQLPEPFTAAAERFGLERTISYGRLPGGLVMLNWPLHGNDWHGDLARAFAPEPAVRATLADAMRAHSLRFASALEEASGGWLQRAACFPDRQAAASGALEGAGSLALMPYWREGRRLVGRELVLEQQLLPQGPGAAIAALPRDGDGRITSIAVGNYANDHHYPGPDWALAPKSCRWGGRWSGTPFSIPYGALVSAELENLLAADKGFSTSHMANGATRLQPLIFNVGQAAGAAAALAVARDLRPADMPVRALQELLLGDPLAPAGPVPLWDTPWHHPDWAARQRAVLDDPSRISGSGELAGLRGHAPPSEPHERLWSGELSCDGQGGYQLACAGQLWPVISLEPALHQWLQNLDRPRSVRLMGCLNPWGPWLRASRLAD
jgi:hypothetical protein